MSVYEAIGSALVIYMACCGIVAHGWAVIHGLRTYKRTLEVGEHFESGSVRDELERSIR